MYAAGHGVREVGSGEPVDSGTLFAIASNTKAFTAAALALLVDERRITWDDKVIDHLPQFRLADPYVTSVLTIRDLLTHRSGLGPYSGDLLSFPATDFTRAEIMARLRYLPMTSEFRSEYAYDNHLYMVAGEVLEAVTETPWETFVQERVLDELGLAPCAATYSQLEERANLARPHALVDGELETVPPSANHTGAAAGSIWCNVDGMTRWMLLHLAEGKTTDGRQFVSEEQHREMWSPQTITKVSRQAYEWNRTHFSAYGLGWGLVDFDGYLRVGHTGGLPGMVSQVTIFPELELGVVVLTNQEARGAYSAISYQIAKAYTESEASDWVAIFSQRMAERQAEADTTIAAARPEMDRGEPSLPLEAYAGTYSDPWRGPVEIYAVDDKLRMRFSHTDGLVGDLEHHAHDTFVVRWQDRSINADAYVKFSLDFDGAIEAISMRAVSPLTDPSYDFHDLALRPTTGSAAVRVEDDR